MPPPLRSVNSARTPRLHCLGKGAVRIVVAYCALSNLRARLALRRAPEGASS